MSSEFKAVLVNEATGEIEYLTEDILDVVDTTLGSVSHEVEVVTVDDYRRRIRNSTSTTQSIVKPVVTPLLSPPGGGSGSSSSVTGTGGTVLTQQPALLRNTPTLLRNSRTSARSVQQQQQQQQQAQPAVSNSAQEVIFLPTIQLDTSGSGTTPSVLPPASAQFIRTVEEQTAPDGTQLIVYNCGDNQFDIIEDNNVQLRLCQVLQSDETEEGGQSTIYICEQEDGSVSFAEDVADEYSNIQVVEELPILQDEHGNVYEVEQYPGHQQIELEFPMAGPAAKKKKKVVKVEGGKELVSPVRMAKRPLCDLKCMEPGCTYAGMNIGELRKHLTAAHGLSFDEETIVFPSENDFKLWRETYERERMVSFIFRGGTKKISREQAVTYLICHRSGHYKPTMKDQSLRKRKMKPQGSCKMNGYCTAGIKLLKNLESGEVKCEICHTHYGHPLDNGAVPHLRVNNVLRKIIWDKFEEGMTFNQVIQYLHHNPDQLEGLRLLDRRAVRNIYDKFRKNPTKKFNEGDFKDDEGSVTSPPVVEKDSKTTVKMEAMETQQASTVDETESNSEAVSVTTPEPEVVPEPPDSEKSVPVDEDKTESSESVVVQPSSTGPSTRRRRTTAKQHTPPPPPPVKKEPEEPVGIRRSARERKPKVFHDEGAPSVKSPRVKVEAIEKPAEEPKKKAKDAEPPILEKVAPVVPVTHTEKEPPVLTADETAPPADEKTESEVEVPKKESKVPVKPSRRKSTTADGEAEEVITEELKKTIQNMLQHGESGPTVLMYKKPGTVTPEFGRKDTRMHKDDFILIIQTPVQRQLMQMFSDVINIDFHKGRPRDLKLMWVLVLDEFRESIPVAWLITNNIDDRVVSIFLRTLYSYAGDVQTHYVMAPLGSEYAKLWSSAFKCDAQMILNEEETKRDMRIEVAENFADTVSRRILNGLMSDMMNAFEEEAFIKSYDDFVEYLTTEHGEKGKKFLKQFDNNWLSRRTEWALVHRVGAPANTIYASDAFGKLKKFIAFKGTKILNSCIEPILKIGYDKCFSRSKRIFKGDQKILKVIEEIEMQHSWGADMDPDSFAAEGSYWTVKLPDGKTRKVFATKSPCRCKFICPKCQVCMHQYICDCNMCSVDHIMCSHIHFVHLMTDQEALTIPEAADEETTEHVPVILTVVEDVSAMVTE